MRASSTSSGARQAVAPVPSPPRRARAVALDDLVEIAQRPPIDDAAADQPERVEAPTARVLGQHEPRPGVGRGEHPAEALEQPPQALAAPAQPCRAFEALRGRGRAHLGVDVREQRRPAVAVAGEQRERLVESPAIEVGIQVAQARGQAAAHLPVRARPGAARQLAGAVAQAEERVELLDAARRPSPGREAGPR